MNSRSFLKRLARRIVSSAAFFGGYCLLASLLRIGPSARILCYHSVNDRPTNSFAVSATDFAEQMRFLAQRFQIISIDRLVDSLKGRKTLPSRAVAVTVDDGYRDAYTHAYPILVELKIPATIFLPVDFIGAKSVGKGADKFPLADFLSWDQMREMSQNGIIFGSHTLTHVSLTKLSTRDIRYQLERSKAKLETEIGTPVTGFAYPYGTVRDFNPEIEQLVAAAGYSWAVTGINGTNTYRSNLFALRRTKLERDDGMIVFKKAVRGSLDPWVVVDRFGWFLQGQDCRES